MKIFTAGLNAETNTFSPIPTGMDDFNVIRPDDLKDGTHQLSDIIPFAGWQQKARARKDHFKEFTFNTPEISQLIQVADAWVVKQGEAPTKHQYPSKNYFLVRSVIFR